LQRFFSHFRLTHRLHEAFDQTLINEPAMNVRGLTVKKAPGRSGNLPTLVHD
jgi:hypothetical protein